jgi:predicted lactoylglutathione lyase
MNTFKVVVLIGFVLLLSRIPEQRDSYVSANQAVSFVTNSLNKKKMKLGAFSVSLNVKDLIASKTFYEKLGFEVLGGDIKKNYLIMKNENALIGLFHGMFENNILTFNPGWNESGKEIATFDDIRVVEQMLKDKGIKLDSEIAKNTKGPASLIIKDPDGNVIFIDQHR